MIMIIIIHDLHPMLRVMNGLETGLILEVLDWDEVLLFINATILTLTRTRTLILIIMNNDKNNSTIAHVSTFSSH